MDDEETMKIWLSFDSRIAPNRTPSVKKTWRLTMAHSIRGHVRCASRVKSGTAHRARTQARAVTSSSSPFGRREKRERTDKAHKAASECVRQRARARFHFITSACVCACVSVPQRSVAHGIQSCARLRIVVHSSTRLVGGKMKQTLIFSNPSKVHDLRSLQSPSSVRPQPSSPTSAAVHPHAASGFDHHGSNNFSAKAPSPRPSLGTAPVAATGTPPIAPARLGPKNAGPGNLKSMRQFFFDSTRSLMQRMPSLHAILKDAPAPRKKSAASTSEPSRAATTSVQRSRAFRDYGSRHLGPDTDRNNVSYRWVIMPRAPWKVRWDLWIGLIIFYSVILIPYRIGFGIDVEVQ